jgi:formylglycine-generating enzyme required for sulfatase activity
MTIKTNEGSGLSRRNLLIRGVAGLLALPAARSRWGFANAQTATTSADGDPIPDWTIPVYSGAAAGSDGRTVYIPEGMVFVPEGSFIMGASNSPTYTANPDGSVSSKMGDTRHAVTLSDYCISKYPVTNAQYKAFCDEVGDSYRPAGPKTGSSRSYWDNPEFDWAQKGNHPVLWVSYNNAVDYCDWVAMKTGWSVSLPSEAQWERAARGQTATGTEYVYPWGNATSATDYRDNLNFNTLIAVKNGAAQTVNGKTYPYWPFVITASNSSMQVTNFKAIAHGYDDTATSDIDESSSAVQALWNSIMNGGGYTSAAGSYPASPSGCYDMAGNAFEWTLDYFTISYYLTLAGAAKDPCVTDVSVLTSEDQKSGSDGGLTNPDGQPTKIVRGGSWYANESSCLTHHRTETRSAGAGAYHSVGFRIVATPVV